MAASIKARVNGAEFDRAELSKMWESTRAQLGGPEILLEPETDGVVTLTFQPSGADARHERFRGTFERAVETYWPQAHVEWLDG
ncbi:MAG TPA: hypothetical protein VN442_03900 [Bryobacteraceae bacterium]|nr:hypothetical protein [Bryobacteraceae bacterium]